MAEHLVPDKPQSAAPAAAAVLLVDDHPIFRRGLRALLETQDWVGMVHEAATAAEAHKVSVTEPVDVVCMDLRLNPAEFGGAYRPAGEPEEPEGLAATRSLLRARPGVAVLVLTMVLDARYVADALTAGARGYLLKSAEPEDVVDALHLVWRGGLVLGLGVGPAVLRMDRTRADWPAPFSNLRDGERQLVQLLAAGMPNSRIARTLGVTDKTVRNRVSALLVRLAVPDRVAVALLAREQGIRGPERL